VAALKSSRCRRRWVEIEPEWRGFLCFVYLEEIVLIDPGDMTIGAVVAVF